MNKTYLGDGVYLQQYPGGYLLTTENGISVENEIYLEPEVLCAFLRAISPPGVDYFDVAKHQLEQHAKEVSDVA